MYLVDNNVLNLLDDLDTNSDKINPWSVKDAIDFTKKLIEDIISSFCDSKRTKFKFNSHYIVKPELWKILENNWKVPIYITIWHLMIMLELVIVWYNNNLEWNPISNLKHNTRFMETVIVVITNIINHINIIIESNDNLPPKLIWRI